MPVAERALQGMTAVVTGASSGIGAEMARILGRLGADLVITARRTDRLERVAVEIRTLAGVRVDVVAADLGDPSGAARLWEAVMALRPRIDIWINNAGFGIYEPFWETAWPRHAELLQLNVVSLVELSHRFVNHALPSANRAYLCNVSSMIAYISAPYYASYAASKVYVRNFSESLAAELAGTHITVTSVCPGATATEFLEVAGQRVSKLVGRTLMSSERCARIAIAAMLRGRRNVVTGVLNTLACWGMRLAPRRAVAAIARRVIGTPANRALPPRDA